MAQPKQNAKGWKHSLIWILTAILAFWGWSGTIAEEPDPPSEFCGYKVERMPRNTRIADGFPELKKKFKEAYALRIREDAFLEHGHPNPDN